MIRSYDELESILDDIKFREFYLEKISKQNFVIDYGAKKGTLKLLGVKDAAQKYDYEVNKKYVVNIDKQLQILNKAKTQNDHYDSDVVLACIEVFDWGQVQKSNIIEALYRYRNRSLTGYLTECKSWFEQKEFNNQYPETCIWSSGWTKVYSLMFDKTTIYDSRVAAFINFILVRFSHSLNNKDDIESLAKVTSNLLSFKGAVGRARYVSDEDRAILQIKGKSSSHKKNMYANKVASWFLEYIAKLEFGEKPTQTEFRAIDKAAFMLGFDIAQISSKVNFQ